MTDEEDEEDEAEDDLATSRSSETTSTPWRRRRTPQEMDRLRAAMLTKGYPLGDVDLRTNEHLFKSLVERRRQGQVLALLGWSSEQYAQALQTVRRQRKATGRR
jgi:hypothetical protein